MEKACDVIQIDPALCIGCGLCAAECIRDSILLQDGIALPGEGECNDCGHCYAVCPRGAVTYADGWTPPVQKGAMPTAEDIAWLLRSRRSVRHFRPEGVTEEDLARILDVGRYAPTARNAQNVTFKVLSASLPTLEEELDALLLSDGQPPQGEQIREGYMFRGAGTAIVVCSPSAVNGAIAAAYMELYAKTLGYGAVYVGRLVTALQRFPALRSRFALEEDETPVTCLALGPAAVTYHRLPRREECKVQRLP